MFDLKRLDLGFRAVAGLQAGNHPAAFTAQFARLIERRVIAIAHETAIAGQNGQRVAQRGVQSFDQLRQALGGFIRTETGERGQHGVDLFWQTGGYFNI